LAPPFALDILHRHGEEALAAVFVERERAMLHAEDFGVETDTVGVTEEAIDD
jgi:hypothetical protein